MGPYKPRGSGINQLFDVICVACGSHAYFRVAADVTYASGQGADRAYGVGGVVPDTYFAGAGVTTYKLGVLDAFDFVTNTWSGSDHQYSAINGGTATNHVEFDVKPDASGGATYYVIVNGKTLITSAGHPVYQLQPDFYLEWHSVGVMFDNFECEELMP